MGTAIVTATLLLSFYLLRTFLNFTKAIRAVRNHPGYRHFTHTNGPIGIIFQRPRRGILVGGFWPWIEKWEPFRRFGVDVITAISAFPTPDTVIWVADAQVTKEVLTTRPLFNKPVEYLKFLDVFGGNIVSSEGDEWKRHRKVCAPSFSEPNNRLVFQETVHVMKELFRTVWGETRKEVKVGHMVSITHSVALYVVGKAGFGRPVSWTDTSDTPSQRKLTFKKSLAIVVDSLLFRALVPQWIWAWKSGPVKSVRDMQTGFEEFEGHMTDMIHTRIDPKLSDADRRPDLFSNLLKASDYGGDGLGGKGLLSKSELFGDIFLFLFAGQESTAHTMSFVFGLLALYQDEQETLYQQVKEICGEDDPNYYDTEKLTKCIAFINETLRMYPPVPLTLRCASEDTVLTTTSHATGEDVVLPVPKGTKIAISITAVHYNPRYWTDPHEFKPSRFLDKDWPRDAFLPFSSGVRACLGKRFVELELVAAVATTLAQYKVELPPDVLNAGGKGETLRQRRERVLKCKHGNTVTPVHVPLVFKKRQRNTDL